MIHVAVALAALALGGPMSHESPRAERVTHGVPVICLAPHDFRAWAKQAGVSFGNPLWDGVWDYQQRTIIIGLGDCRMITNWRHENREDVRDAVWTLGHEYRHSQQHGGEPPFALADENDADCWSARHLSKLARALGIVRRLPPVANACG